MNKQFNYGIPKVKIGLSLVLLTALPLLFLKEALTQTGALRYRGITIPEHISNPLLWGLFVILAITAIVGFFALYNASRNPKSIELGVTQALLPKASIFGGQLNIPYQSITGVSRQKITKNEEMVIIKSLVGESRILSSNFKDLFGFDDFLVALKQAIDSNLNSLSGRIPLTIGFANMAGEKMTSLIEEDIKLLSPLFSQALTAFTFKTPSAEILFVYADLNENGMVNDTITVRQIAEVSGASILVLASPNSQESIIKANSSAGNKTANLVFTIDRNKDGFARFFKELFEKMRDGKPLSLAWVELNPQGPNSGNTYAPATIMVMEGGNLGFPKPAN